MKREQGEEEARLAQAKAKFVFAKEQGFLPPKVQEKLELLEQLIAGGEDCLSFLEDEEREALLALRPHEMYTLFVSICESLSIGSKGNNFIVAKKEGFMAGWKPCKLSLSSKGVSLTVGSSSYSFQRDQFSLSEISKDRKGRWTFSLLGKKDKFLIGGFHEVNVVNWRQKILRHLEREVMLSEKSSMLMPEDAVYSQEESEEEPERDLEEETQLVFNDDDFTVLEMTEGFRILQHRFSPLLKACLVVEEADLMKVLQTIHQQQLWNSCLEKSELLTRIDPLTYTMREAHRPQGFFSYPRDFVFLRRAVAQEGVYYLVDSSLEAGHRPEPGYTRGLLRRRVFVVLKHPELERSLIMQLLHCENKGYSTAQGDLARNLQLLRQLKNINESLKLKKFTSKTEESLFATLNQVKLPRFKKKVRLSTPKQSKTPVLERQPPTLQIEGVKRTCTYYFDNLEELLRSKIDVQIALRGREEVSEQYEYYSAEHGPGHCLFNGKWVLRGGSLLFVDQAQIRRQKEVLTSLLKSIGTKLLSGKSIMNISLPIIIFDRFTDLEHIAFRSVLSRHFFRLALDRPPEHRLACVAAFHVTKINVGLTGCKPFNPIIGETFQCFNKGESCYFEQISHHPPISAYYIVGEGYRLYGCDRNEIVLGFNSASVENTSPSHTEFDDGVKFTSYFCAGSMGGTFYGERCFYLTGQLFSLYESQSMVCQICIGKRPSEVHRLTSEERRALANDSVTGGVFRVKPQTLARIKQLRHKYSLSKEDLVSDELVTLRGKCQGPVLLQGQQIYTIDKPLPSKVQYSRCPLPSDSSFRLDRYFKHQDNDEVAQRLKEELEERQRRDKKLRQPSGH